MDDIDNLQAEVLRALAHPRRLQIMHRLADGPVEVGILAAELGMSQPNASQHLAVMRTAGVVEAERIGRTVLYRISDPDVITACGLMRGVLERRFDRLASLTGGIRLEPATPRSTSVPARR
jgi:ArsR family transcriptional regulator